jgi:hypothetical protein
MPQPVSVRFPGKGVVPSDPPADLLIHSGVTQKVEVIHVVADPLVRLGKQQGTFGCLVAARSLGSWARFRAARWPTAYGQFGPAVATKARSS